MKPALVAGSIFATLTILLGCWFVYQKLNEPLDISDAVVIDVKRGASIDSLAAQFSEFVPPLTFRLYGRLTNTQGPVLAGRYEIKVGTSLRTLFAQLRAGNVISYQITFPEGLTFREWRAIMRQDPNLSVSEQADAQLLADLGFAAGSGEGQFFPDTYRFLHGDTEKDIFNRAKSKMTVVLEREWQQRRHDILANPEQVLVLASVVEKETGRADEREPIARVFLNRLEIDMKLQSDPTVIYGLGDEFDGDLRRSDLRNPHPYNTYVHKGLPPTPICMPGLESIRAVLQAPESPYFYFVARGDGSSYFSVTLEEHNRAVNQYQRSLNRKSQQ